MINLYLIAHLKYMKELQDTYIGKDFVLDGGTQVVTVNEVLPDNFARVVFPDGRHASVAIGRLKEVVVIPVPERVEDEKPIDLEYPQKASKVTIEIFDAETGKTHTKWLEGEEATKWNDWMRELCYKAEEVGMNPAWLDLKWCSKKTSK